MYSPRRKINKMDHIKTAFSRCGLSLCKYGLFISTVCFLGKLMFWTYINGYTEVQTLHTQDISSFGSNKTNLVGSILIGNYVPTSTTNSLPRDKIILLRTSYYEKVFWGENSGRTAFQNNVCNYKNCIATDDHERYGRSADIVVFHCGKKVEKWPKYRSPRQIYVAACMESPPHTREWSFEQFNGRANATATYRLDSDIPTPYYRVVRKGSSGNPLHVPEVNFENKTRGVAWMVSHCSAISKRDKYVKQLQKYIPVDVYGKCGPKNCSRGTDCKNLIATYKFYLAFENSICRDYVTEKVYNELLNGVVPVVLGGANYSEHVPPNSVINAGDFNSPKELADYLKGLGENEAEYMKYFQWRSNYDIVVSSRYGLFCDMCKMANEGTFHRHTRNLHEWWTKDTCDNNVVQKMINNAKIH